MDSLLGQRDDNAKSYRRIIRAGRVKCKKIRWLFRNAAKLIGRRRRFPGCQPDAGLSRALGCLCAEPAADSDVFFIMVKQARDCRRASGQEVRYFFGYRERAVWALEAHEMRLAYALFAKCADLAADGTFSLIGGGFEGIEVEQFPARIPMLALLIHVLIDPDDVGRPFDLRTEVTDPNGERIGHFSDVRVMAGREPETGRAPTGATCLFVMTSADFPVAGDYRFRVSVGEQSEFASLSLRITQKRQEGA